MIVTITLAPALDKTAVIPGFAADRVNRVQSLRLDAGGKGINVSKVLRALGTDSLACGILGGGAGRYIADQLGQMGIPCDFAWVSGETRTNLKIVDPENGTHTDINEPGFPVGAEVLEDAFRRADNALEAGDIAVLAGKAPPQADPGVYAGWIRRLQARGVAAFLDADGELLARGIGEHPALIKPNREELCRLVGRELASDGEVLSAARELVRGGVGMAAVSLGEEGALFVTRDAALRGYGLSVPVRSTVGAGDSMMAALAHARQKGLPLREACALALAVSAAAVSTEGTQAPDRAAVEALMAQARVESVE